MDATMRAGTVDADREAFYRFAAAFLADSPRLAYSRRESAEKLGVSVEFFEHHVAPEIKVVKRGRRLLVPAAELIYWLWRSAR